MAESIMTLFVLGVLCLVVFVIWKIYQKQSAKNDLEENMQCNSASRTKALLVVRGHLLSKELRVAAENWVEEMEEKSKEK